MYGLTRGAMTLIGAASAGLLLWLATQVDTDSSGGYWAFMGLLAAAGLTIALSQLLGGWTKWGWPRVSLNVLAFAFVPALIAGGWVILAHEPGSSSLGTRANDWAGDIGLGAVLDDMATVVPALAFGLGLLLGLVLDTTGPRVREVERDRRVEHHDDAVATEPVTAERGDREARISEEYRAPDPDAVTALTSRPDRRVEIREGGSPIAPQPAADDDVRDRD